MDTVVKVSRCWVEHQRASLSTIALGFLFLLGLGSFLFGADCEILDSFNSLADNVFDRFRHRYCVW